MLDEYERIVQYLQETTDKPEKLVYGIEGLIHDPVNDPRILPYLEKLCADTRIVRIGAPASYSEIRYMAAYALRAQYEILGIDAVVYLRGILKPLTNQQLVGAFEKVEGGWPYLGIPLIDAYKMLAEMRKAPTYNLKLAPRKYKPR